MRLLKDPSGTVESMSPEMAKNYMYYMRGAGGQKPPAYSPYMVREKIQKLTKDADNFSDAEIDEEELREEAEKIDIDFRTQKTAQENIFNLHFMQHF